MWDMYDAFDFEGISAVFEDLLGLGDDALLDFAPSIGATT
jgi:hypothetical protein